MSIYDGVSPYPVQIEIKRATTSNSYPLEVAGPALERVDEDLMTVPDVVLSDSAYIRQLQHKIQQAYYDKFKDSDEETSLSREKRLAKLYSVLHQIEGFSLENINIEVGFINDDPLELILNAFEDLDDYFVITTSFKIDDRVIENVSLKIRNPYSQSLSKLLENPFSTIPGNRFTISNLNNYSREELLEFFVICLNNIFRSDPIKSTVIDEIKNIESEFLLKVDHSRFFASELINEKYAAKWQSSLISAATNWVNLLIVPTQTKDIKELLTKYRTDINNFSSSMTDGNLLSDYIVSMADTINYAINNINRLHPEINTDSAFKLVVNLRQVVSIINSTYEEKITEDNYFVKPLIFPEVVANFLVAISYESEKLKVEFEHIKAFEEIKAEFLDKLSRSNFKHNMTLEELFDIILSNDRVKEFYKEFYQQHIPLSFESKEKETWIPIKNKLTNFKKFLEKVRLNEINNQGVISQETKTELIIQLSDIVLSLENIDSPKSKNFNGIAEFFSDFLLLDQRKITFDKFIINGLAEPIDFLLKKLEFIPNRSSKNKKQRAKIHETTSSSNSTPIQVEHDTVEVTIPFERQPHHELEDIVVSYLKLGFINTKTSKDRCSDTVNLLKEKLKELSISDELQENYINQIFEQAQKGWFPPRGSETVIFGTSHLVKNHSSKISNDSKKTPRLSDHQQRSLLMLKDEFFAPEISKEEQEKIIAEQLAAKERTAEQARIKKQLAAAEAAKKAKEEKLRADAKFEEEFARLLAEEEAAQLRAEEETKIAAENAERNKRAAISEANQRFTKLFTPYPFDANQISAITDTNPELGLALKDASDENITQARRLLVQVFGATNLSELIKTQPNLLIDAAFGNLNEKELSKLRPVAEQLKSTDNSTKESDTPNYRDTSNKKPSNPEINTTDLIVASNSLPLEVKTVINLAFNDKKFGRDFAVRFIKLKDRAELINVVEYSLHSLNLSSSQIAKLLYKDPTLMTPPKDGQDSFKEFIENKLKPAFKIVGLNDSDIGEFLLSYSKAMHPRIEDTALELTLFYEQYGFQANTANSARIFKELILYGQEKLEAKLERLLQICEKYEIKLQNKDILVNYPQLLGFINNKKPDQSDSEIARDERLISLLVKAAITCEESITPEHIQSIALLNPNVLEAAIKRDPLMISVKAIIEDAVKAIIEDAVKLQKSFRILHSESKTDKIDYLQTTLNRLRKNCLMTDSELVEYLEQFNTKEIAINDTFGVWKIKQKYKIDASSEESNP
jgi:hypothetical protein